MTSFANRLKGLRGDVPQAEFAKILGISHQSTYFRYEGGGDLPKADTLFQIARALGCSADYLLGRSEKRFVKSAQDFPQSSMLATRLRELRGGISPSKFARILAMSPNTYGRYEKGETSPISDVLIKIAESLNCSVDYLMGISDNRFSSIPRRVQKLYGPEVVKGVVVAPPGTKPFVFSQKANQAVKALAEELKICENDLAWTIRDLVEREKK